MDLPWVVRVWCWCVEPFCPPGRPWLSGDNHRMKMPALRRAVAWWSTVLLAGAMPAAQAQATSSVYYVCPGNVFTNTITAKEAESRGCKAREAQQPTTISGPKPRPVQGGSPAPSSSAGKSSDRIDAQEQRSRDSDARRILEAELRKEEGALETLKREYNNGEPERRGEERNAQKYLDRIAELKAAVQRKEADVAAIRREIGKLPG